MGCVCLCSSSLPTVRFSNTRFSATGSLLVFLLQTSIFGKIPEIGCLQNLGDMATTMASNENLKSVHYLSAKPSVNFQIPEDNIHSRHEIRQPIRRRKCNMTALIIIAIALALLLVAVIVIGTTRRQTSNSDAPSESTNPTGAGSTPAPSPPAEPPGGNQSLSWCEERDEGICTLGVYQNLDTGQIRAQVFDHTCSSAPRIIPT